jgi:hypothetical protein
MTSLLHNEQNLYLHKPLQICKYGFMASGTSVEALIAWYSTAKCAQSQCCHL